MSETPKLDAAARDKAHDAYHAYKGSCSGAIEAAITAYLEALRPAQAEPVAWPVVFWDSFAWIAMARDMDICAQGKTPYEAMQQLVVLRKATIAYAQKHGHLPGPPPGPVLADAIERALAAPEREAVAIDALREINRVTQGWVKHTIHERDAVVSIAQTVRVTLDALCALHPAPPSDAEIGATRHETGCSLQGVPLAISSCACGLAYEAARPAQAEPVAWVYPKRWGSGLSFAKPADCFDEDGNPCEPRPLVYGDTPPAPPVEAGCATNWERDFPIADAAEAALATARLSEAEEILAIVREHGWCGGGAITCADEIVPKIRARIAQHKAALAPATSKGGMDE